MTRFFTFPKYIEGVAFGTSCDAFSAMKVSRTSSSLVGYDDRCCRYGSESRSPLRPRCPASLAITHLAWYWLIAGVLGM